MSTALATIDELEEVAPPPPARPRVLLVATTLGTGASVAVVLGTLALYLHARAEVLAGAADWGLDLPLTPANLSLVGFGISMFTVQWAVQAIGADDRRHAWLAFGATIIVASMHVVGTAFLFSEAKAEVATVQGGLFYAVMGAHLAMLLVAVVFLALMCFRTLGGQYSAKDREGVVAAAVFWHATVVVYAVIWYAVLVTK